MELSEAIKQLEDLREDRKSFLENNKEHDEIFSKDIEAIDIVLQALEQLQEENAKLKTKNRTQKKLTEYAKEVTNEQVVSTIEEFEKDYISKDKIKEKIEKLKKELPYIACNEGCDKCFDKDWKPLYRGSKFDFCYAYYQIKVLQELLEEE